MKHTHEAEAGQACALVGEIVEARAGGNRDSAAGNSDDDLLYALEEARDAIAAAIAGLRERVTRLEA